MKIPKILLNVNLVLDIYTEIKTNSFTGGFLKNLSQFSSTTIVAIKQNTVST